MSKSVKIYDEDYRKIVELARRERRTITLMVKVIVEFYRKLNLRGDSDALLRRRIQPRKSR